MHLLFALVMACGTAPATQPATAPASPIGVERFDPGTPERVYLELVRAVRQGDFEGAAARLQPAPRRFAQLKRSEMRTLHELEKIKPIMLRRFGPESLDELNMGFLPDRTLRTVRAKVEGDRAALSFVLPDTNDREETDILLHRQGGEWKVDWRNYAAPAVVLEEEEKATDEDIRLAAESEVRARPAIERVARALEAGEFRDPFEVQEALLNEFTFGRR